MCPFLPNSSPYSATPKYIVRSTDEERSQLQEVIKKLKDSSQKVRRAQILLKADIEGANWMDAQIAEAFDCRTKTVENICQRLVERGLEETLNGVGRSTPPTEKLLNGEQEAHIVALRLAYIGTFQSTATHGRKGQEIALW